MNADMSENASSEKRPHTFKDLSSGKAAEGLRAAAGLSQPFKNKEAPRSILTLKGPENPQIHNLETEYRHLEAQSIELTLAESRLKSGDQSDSIRKQLIGIDRKRSLAKKRMGEIERALTEMREITRNAFPPGGTLAPETSRVRVPQYWRGTTVAETLEPATMIDESITLSPDPMESSAARRSPEPVAQPESSASVPQGNVVAKFVERIKAQNLPAEAIDQTVNAIQDDRLREKVREQLAVTATIQTESAGDAIPPTPPPPETPPTQTSVPVTDLEREDLAATDLSIDEAVLETADREREDVVATGVAADVPAIEQEPVAVPVADTEMSMAHQEKAAERATPFDEIPQELPKTSDGEGVAETAGGEPAPPQTAFETALRKIHDRDPEQANRILNTIEGKDGPVREKFLKLIAATETQREEQVERAEKSLSEKVFGFVKNMGEQYKSLSFGKKVGIGMALITAVAGGMLLSGAALPAALTAGFTGKRIYGAAMMGMVTAIAVEADRKRYHEKKGGERTEQEAAKDRRHALLMGLLASGGVLAAGQAISGATQIYEHFNGAGAVSARIAELKQELGMGPSSSPTLYETFGQTPEVNAVMNGEAPAASFPEHMGGGSASVIDAAPLDKIEVTVKPGDNLWNLIKERVDAQQLTANLNADQKIRFINSIKNEFAAMSPEELKAIGFGSGNIDMIHPGDTIDLTKVLGDTSFLPEALHDAEMFDGHLAPKVEITPEAAAGISEQVVSAPAASAAEDLPASITETPMDELPENEAPVAPENTLRDSSGETVRDGFGDPVRTGEDTLLDQPYTREQFTSKELGRLNEAIAAGPDRGLADSLNVIYPPADGEVWTVGEKSASWASMKGQSAWELFYRPESLDPSVASNSSTPKLRAFMQGLSEYNIQPERSETVESFLRRALGVVAEKSTNQTWSA